MRFLILCVKIDGQIIFTKIFLCYKFYLKAYFQKKYCSYEIDEYRKSCSIYKFKK